MARETYIATVESGECKEFARLDLGEIHLWLYPQEDGTVMVETEEKYKAGWPYHVQDAG